MSTNKVVLGLDVGVGSAGWGLIRLTEEKYTDEMTDGTIEERYKITDGEIIDTGIREFQLPQDRQKKSLALQRGSARRSRKTTRRKARRLKKLIELAKEFDLIGQDFNRDNTLKPKKGDKENTWDIWLIRKQALERKLTDTELFRVLYHIAKHRGFYFHTKAEEIQKEDTKSETGKEKAKAKAGLARIRKKLEESKWETVGQMFWEEFKQTNAKNRRKRNAPDKYENSIHRLLLKDEIEKIFEKQKRLGNSKAKEELKRRYIDEIVMQEEGIDEEKLQKMMSRCEFTGEICAPKESYTAERFVLFNRLNTLKLVDTKNKNAHLPLENEKRQKIIALAYKNAKVTFAQIRTELALNDDLHLRFNLCSYREKNPEYNKKLECKIENGQLKFEEKHQVPIVDVNTGEVKILDEEIRDIFQKKFKPKYKHITLYYSNIRKELQNSVDFKFSDFRFAELKGYTKSAAELEREAKAKAEKKRKKTSDFDGEAAYVKQFEDDTFVEIKGYHKIKKAIEAECGKEKWVRFSKDVAKHDVVAEALTYHKSDETRIKCLRENGITDKNVINAVLTINMKQLANYSKEALKNLLVHMEDKDEPKLFNEAKEKCGYGKIEHKKQAILKPYSGFFENNPVVARVISQTRKVINAIVRKYNAKIPIDQIHIEVATELANSKRRKTEIAQGQRRYREDKMAAEERCRKFDLDPNEGQNLLMFRLAEQQNNFCPYTAKAIKLYPTGADNEVYIKDCEIDHIIPMSRSFNDGLNNKVVCTQQANQNKTDRIPFEWFEDMYGKDCKEWADFERRVKKMYSMPYSKKRNLLRKSWTEEDKERFISRDLNDTRYAARHIADYMRKYFDFSKSKRADIKDVSRIQLRSGGVTAFLRHMWGLNKDRDENDLHHATDALVVACSTYGHVYLVSNLSKEIERKHKNWYKHFGRDKFKPWSSIREDIEDAVSKVFISRMPRHTVTGGAHKETITSLEKMPEAKRVIKINKGYAEMGDMVRADVFVDEAGKNYVVPIYTVDIFQNKPLPDKYLYKDDTPYEQWPSVKEDNLKFKFSLFKDDLISINGEMYYVDWVGGTRADISVKSIDGSAFEGKKGTKTKKYRRVKLKKYSVDILGNYKEIKQERRLGNKFER